MTISGLFPVGGMTLNRGGCFRTASWLYKYYINYNDIEIFDPIEKTAVAVVASYQGDFLTTFNRGV